MLALPATIAPAPAAAPLGRAAGGTSAHPHCAAALLGAWPAARCFCGLVHAPSPAVGHAACVLRTTAVTTYIRDAQFLRPLHAFRPAGVRPRPLRALRGWLQI
eukprot:5849102-Alexandrium_andersonii.AAC.1